MARLNLGDLLDPDPEPDPKPDGVKSERRDGTTAQPHDGETAQRNTVTTADRHDTEPSSRHDGDTAHRQPVEPSQQQYGTPPRRRATKTAQRLAATTAPRQDTPPSPAPVLPGRWKFTMLLSDLDDERARRVVDDVLAIARIRPTKGMRADVVRALLAEADQDPELRARLAQRVRDASA